MRAMRAIFAGVIHSEGPDFPMETSDRTLLGRTGEVVRGGSSRWVGFAAFAEGDGGVSSGDPLPRLAAEIGAFHARRLGMQVERAGGAEFWVQVRHAMPQPRHKTRH